MFQRVLPRDLFNESKLLKCLGQLILTIHDGVDNNKFNTKDIKFYHDDSEHEGFNICQDIEGNLYCSNIQIYVKNQVVPIFTTYNSKEPYPLMFYHNDEEGYVLNSNGTISNDFIELIKAITG